MFTLIKKSNVLNLLENQTQCIFVVSKNLTQLLCYCLLIRKIPWIHVQTEDSREKDPEVISTVGQNDNMSKVKLSEFPSPKELMEKELEARSSGTLAASC